MSKPKATAPTTETIPKSEDEDTVRLVVVVPRRVHRKLKAAAALEGKQIREYVLDLLATRGID